MATHLLKPSEQVSSCSLLLAKMLQDTDAPGGMLNIIHGQQDGKSWFLLPFCNDLLHTKSQCGILMFFNICFLFIYVHY